MSPPDRWASVAVVQGSSEIVEFLNEALTAELTAINQYFAHAKLCENWGWQRLAAKYREESIEEMRDAEYLMDRIIFLDGMPNMQRLGSVRIGETVLEQLEVDRELEVAAIERYRRGVALALEHGDPGTRELLERLVVGEEGHLDWIDTQLSMIADIGIELYTQHQIGD
jgi:bacterioferritin